MFYSVFGLSLRANQPISGLVASPPTKEADVQVWLGSMPSWRDPVPERSEQEWYSSPLQDEYGEPSLKVTKPAGGAYFRIHYSDGTEFVVDRQGSRIWAVWPETLTPEDTATYLLGPILGFVLRLRGITCLHASAIAIGGHAIALLGPAGAGKSTTAAAFAKRGYPVLSDDIAALREHDGAFLVQPAYPRLRLWPESVHALYGTADVLPRLTPTWDKRYLDLTRDDYQFGRQPLPLAAIYVLDERRADPSAPLVSAVPLQAGLITLVTHTYVNYLLDQALRAREFELLGRVMAGVPLRRVHPHADQRRLSRLCEVILDDFQTLTPSGAARHV